MATGDGRGWRTLLILFALPPHAAGGQEPVGAIQDNSFLLEEAYNQEAGVVQHISFFSRGGDRSWQYAFTQEWPVGGQRHQFSYTLLLLHAGSTGATGIGDAALNYRYQLVGDGTRSVAVAPRLSLLLPTGSASRELGAGHAGVQVNVPASWAISRRLVTHWNAGVTHVPSARDGAGNRRAITGLNLGQSTIWLVTPTVNLMLETAWNRDQAVAGPDVVVAAHRFFVSPGVRLAVNRPGGLQIVPGIAVPVGVGPSRGNTAVVLYLSLEHPFKN